MLLLIQLAVSLSSWHFCSHILATEHRTGLWSPSTAQPKQNRCFESAPHTTVGTIAAVIVEPVVGNMGVVPPAPGFLEALRELTRAAIRNPAALPHAERGVRTALQTPGPPAGLRVAFEGVRLLCTGPFAPLRATTFVADLAQLNTSGDVSDARIDDAVRRILTQKFELGLFEHPFADRTNASTIGSAAHRAIARQAVAVLAVAAYTFLVTYGIGKVIDRTMGVRASEEEELTGLDQTVHAESAYDHSGLGHAAAQAPGQSVLRLQDRSTAP